MFQVYSKNVLMSRDSRRSPEVGSNDRTCSPTPLLFSTQEGARGLASLPMPRPAQPLTAGDLRNLTATYSARTPKTRRRSKSNDGIGGMQAKKDGSPSLTRALARELSFDGVEKILRTTCEVHAMEYVEGLHTPQRSFVRVPQDCSPGSIVTLIRLGGRTVRVPRTAQPGDWMIVVSPKDNYIDGWMNL